MGQTACAFVPRFELALRACRDPALWKRPLASVDWSSKPPRLLAVTPAAEALGAAVGQIASRVRARLPELECLPPDEALRQQAEGKVLAALAKLSPRLDSDGRGAFFLGLEGLERLAPDLDDFLRRVISVFRSFGFLVAVTLAESPFVAWVAAQRLARGTLPPSDLVQRVIGEGEEQRVLGETALGELDLAEPARELLALLGIRTAGELRSLPPGSLAERLGPAGARLERLCRGQDFPIWPTSAKLPRDPERVELELDQPLEGLEPLVFILKSLVDRLISALATERLALLELEVSARLDDRSEVEARFVPDRPALTSAPLLDLLRLWLDEKPFVSPVAALRLTAVRAGAAGANQLSLLAQREEQAALAFAKAVTRLTAAFGENAVLVPELLDSFRPESRLGWARAISRLAKPEAAARQEAASRSPEKFSGAPLALALRRLDPPEPVAFSEGAFLVRRQERPVRIVRLDGPQRLAGEWWGAGFDRSYYWLLLETGELAWTFRDEASGELYLQALAD